MYHFDSHEECRKYCADKIRVAKVLGLSMDMIEGLLDSLPSLKVIYLLRDPRATMVSRLTHMGAKRFLEENIIDTSRALCERMLNDISISKTIQQKYPLRFKSITYESIAREPIPKAVEMYNFIDYVYQESDLERIRMITNSPQSSDKVGQVKRANSTATSENWKYVIKPRIKNTIDSSCSKTYTQLRGFGYAAP